MLKQDELKYLLNYDLVTGEFTWRNPRANVLKVGQVAGTTNKLGYKIICIRMKSYQAHRLAWLWVYGCMPSNHIDHIDGNPSNNRIENLRDVTRSVNMQNKKKACKGNTSGYLGVSWNKKIGKFVSEISFKGKRLSLGSFDDPKIAHEAYLSAKRKYHEGNTL